MGSGFPRTLGLTESQVYLEVLEGGVIAGGFPGKLAISSSS